MIKDKKFDQETYLQFDTPAKEAMFKWCKGLPDRFELKENDLENVNQPDVRLERGNNRKTIFLELQVLSKWGGDRHYPYPTFYLFYRKYKKLFKEWAHLKNNLFFVTLSNNLQKAIIAPANLFEHLGTQKELPMDRPGEGHDYDRVISLDIKYCTEVNLSQAPYEQLEKIYMGNEQVIKDMKGRKFSQFPSQKEEEKGYR